MYAAENSFVSNVILHKNVENEVDKYSKKLQNSVTK